MFEIHLFCKEYRCFVSLTDSIEDIQKFNNLCAGSEIEIISLQDIDTLEYTDYSYNDHISKKSIK